MAVHDVWCCLWQLQLSLQLQEPQQQPMAAGGTGGHGAKVWYTLVASSMQPPCAPEALRSLQSVCWVAVAVSVYSRTGLLHCGGSQGLHAARRSGMQCCDGGGGGERGVAAALSWLGVRACVCMYVCVALANVELQPLYTIWPGVSVVHIYRTCDTHTQHLGARDCCMSCFGPAQALGQQQLSHVRMLHVCLPKNRNAKGRLFHALLTHNTDSVHTDRAQRVWQVPEPCCLLLFSMRVSFGCWLCVAD